MSYKSLKILVLQKNLICPNPIDNIFQFFHIIILTQVKRNISYENLTIFPIMKLKFIRNYTKESYKKSILDEDISYVHWY